MTSSLPQLDNMQKLIHKKNNTYQTENLDITIVNQKFMTMTKSNQMNDVK
jgi:hypothetical protein